jgi:hypothetical protein
MCVPLHAVDLSRRQMRERGGGERERERERLGERERAKRDRESQLASPPPRQVAYRGPAPVLLGWLVVGIRGVHTVPDP